MSAAWLAARRCLRALSHLPASGPEVGQQHRLPALVRAVSSSTGAPAELIKPTVPPAPGTVSAYQHHVLVRPAPPTAEGATDDKPWWPPVVEKHPALLQAFSAVAKHRDQIEGVVKVTAFEHATPSETSRLKKDTCDLMIFPAGVSFEGLPLSRVKEVVEAHVVEAEQEVLEDSALEGGNRSPASRKSLEGEDEVQGMGIFVCTHGSRDCRCGSLGSALVRRLNALVEEQGLDLIRVFQVSHVGGHKYAGNVLVYGLITPCDGDWFGGINTHNAEQFLDALVEVDVGTNGGAEHPTLRRWWRGRMGLSKEEQLMLFEQSTGIPRAELADAAADESTSDSDSESSSSSSDDSSDIDGDTPEKTPIAARTMTSL